MICIECFNRSRVDGLQLVCSPFFCRLVPSLASGVEYCHGCNFAPVWRPRWHQAWSIATAATLRPSGAPVGIRHGVLPRLRLCARLVPSLASGMEYCHGCNFASVPGATTLHYTRYTISQILGILHPCPLVIDLIEHHRY